MNGWELPRLLAAAHAGRPVSLAEHRSHHAVALLQQDGQQMLGLDLGVVARGGEREGGLDRLLRLGCEAVELHRQSS